MGTSKRRYLLRIESADRDDATLVALVEAAGAEVDADFGVVPLDPARRRVILRGRLSDEAAAALVEQGEIELFIDPQIGTHPPGEGV